MIRRRSRVPTLGIALICRAGLALAAPAPADLVVEPGPEVQDRLQEALIEVEPGQVIEISAGRYELTDALSLDVDRVTVRGAGMDRTVLSFKGQLSGSEGLLITSDGVTLSDLAIEDTRGDAVKVRGADGISLLRVRTEWTGGPKPTNGAYGLYPVSSRDVLIEGCVARGASDAGIYVGQSQRIVVRKNRAELNVAGIEIENSWFADVYDNVTTRNTGGILVFDLPELPQQGGRDIRVFKNQVFDNDTPNFAPPGNIVGLVPNGTGILIMANRRVEVFENDIRGHQTASVIVASYLATRREYDDPKYRPFPEGIHIHHNRFGRAGWKPEGQLAQLFLPLMGTPVPDIVWDGVTDPAHAASGVPEEARLYIHDNGDADFINLDLTTAAIDPEKARPSRDLAAHAGRRQPLPPVELGGSSK